LSDSDCSVGPCISSVCVSVSKSCPSNSSTSVCSGAGYCAFRGLDGRNQTACLLGNSLCYAKCLCNSGYGGNGCSVPPAELAVQDQSRGDACSYLTLRAQGNVSSASLAGLASLLDKVYTPSLVVSASSSQACVGTLQSIVNQAANVSLDYNTSESIVNVISSFVDGVIAANAVVSAHDGSSSASAIDLVNVTSALNSFTEAVAKSLQVGASVNFTTNAFSISVQSKPWTDLYNSSLRISGALLSSITLPSSGLDACRMSDQSNHTTYSIMQWNQIPYTNGPVFAAPIVRWQYPVRLAEAASVKNLIDADFLLEMAFFTSQDSLDSLNYTCVERTGDSIRPSGCLLDSLTDEVVVFRCSVIANLCPLNGHIFPSIMSKSSSTLLSSFDLRQQNANVYDISEYGVLITSPVDGTSKVLSTNPFATGTDQAIIVMAVVLAWLLILVLGLFYYSRWDTRDRQMIIYRLKARKLNSKPPAFSEMLTLRRSINNAFLSKSLVSEEQISTEDH
jgi:hypothetical protein